MFGSMIALNAESCSVPMKVIVACSVRLDQFPVHPSRRAGFEPDSWIVSMVWSGRIAGYCMSGDPGAPRGAVARAAAVRRSPRVRSSREVRLTSQANLPHAMNR